MGGTGTLNSGTGASYHHVHLGGSQYYPSAQHPSVQTYCSTAGGHTSSEQQVQQPPTEPYHLQTIQEQQVTTMMCREEVGILFIF